MVGALQDALRQAKQKGQLTIDPFPTVSLDLPKRPEWGDLATTVAMMLASAEKRPPYDVAQILSKIFNRPPFLIELKLPAQDF